MATESDLLRAIIDAPDDNDLKAVFADWLDDHDREKETNSYRFCAENDRHPWSHSMSEDGWSWYPDETTAGFGKRCILPPLASQGDGGVQHASRRLASGVLRPRHARPGRGPGKVPAPGPDRGGPAMPRLTADDLARFRADYHECRVTIMPLVAEIDALTRERDEAREGCEALGRQANAAARQGDLARAEIARVRALLLSVCRQHPNAVLTDGDTTMTLWHLARRLEEGKSDE